MFWLIAGSVAGCTILGAYVSTAKNRPAFEGLMFGFLLGPIGVLVAALLPTQGERPRYVGPTARRERFIETFDDREDRAVKGWLADDGLRGVRP